MENTDNIDRYIDLTSLNEKGRNEILKIYQEFLKKFPKKKKYSASEFQRKVSELSVYNNEKDINISENIDISGITDEMYDGIF